jgi:hypothetical protein
MGLMIELRFKVGIKYLAVGNVQNYGAIIM